MGAYFAPVTACMFFLRSVRERAVCPAAYVMRCVADSVPNFLSSLLVHDCERETDAARTVFIRAVSEGFASLRVLREQGDEDERSRPYGTGNPGKRHGASPGLGACQRTPRGQACGASSPTRPHLRHAVPRRSDGPMEAVPLGTRAEVSTSSSSVVNFGTEASVDAPGVGGAAMEEVAGGEGISELIYRAIEVAEEGCDYADEDWLTTSYAVLDLVGPRMEHG